MTAIRKPQQIKVYHGTRKPLIAKIKKETKIMSEAIRVTIEGSIAALKQQNEDSTDTIIYLDKVLRELGISALNSPCFRATLKKHLDARQSIS